RSNAAALCRRRSNVRGDPHGLIRASSFQDAPVYCITYADVNKSRLEEGASNASVNRELAALKRAFNLGAQAGRVSRDNMPHLPMLEEDNTRTGFFEHEQFLALRDALPEYLRGFVTFGYKTGCRFGEIRGLKWAAVNRKEAIVRLEGAETKNKEARWIPLDRELQAVVTKQASNRRLGCDYVFHLSGRPVGDIRTAWKAACKAAGCEGMLFHDLRRSAVRNMVRSGIPEQVAMRISGHKTRSVFQRYNIIDDDDLKKAALQQEAYLLRK
ncbi:MAG: site-specific integrase, partial [Candidatus Krumholzibacteriia bacterium]